VEKREQTIARVFATGDRKHDTHAVQHFLIEQQQWFLANVKDEKFSKFYPRSDDAGRHF